jgi:hypothetical protein
MLKCSYLDLEGNWLKDEVDKHKILNKKHVKSALLTKADNANAILLNLI